MPITDAVDHGTLPSVAVLTDILGEILNYLNERAGHTVAVKYLYSFDDDFDAVGDITRLETAGNPFKE